MTWLCTNDWHLYFGFYFCLLRSFSNFCCVLICVWLCGAGDLLLLSPMVVDVASDSFLESQLLVHFRIHLSLEVKFRLPHRCVLGLLLFKLFCN